MSLSYRHDGEWRNASGLPEGHIHLPAPPQGYQYSSKFSGWNTLVSTEGLSPIDPYGTVYMQSVFSNCYNLIDLTGLASWNMSSVTNMSNMFSGCSSLEDLSPISEWTIGRPNYYSSINMNSMFAYCDSLNDASSLSGWSFISNAEEVYMTGMFTYCISLTEVPHFNFNPTLSIERTVSTASMFEGCESLTDISGLGSWNVTTSNPTSMFRECTSIVTAYVPSGFNVGTNWGYTMFQGCSNLEVADFSNWTPPTSTLRNMLSDCPKIRILKFPDLSGVPADNGNFTAFGLGAPNPPSSLEDIDLPGLTVSVNLAGASLSAEVLNKVYGQLGPTSNATIRVWGNPGAASSDPTIAENKGWTVMTVSGPPPMT